MEPIGKDSFPDPSTPKTDFPLNNLLQGATKIASPFLNSLGKGVPGCVSIAFIPNDSAYCIVW